MPSKHYALGVCLLIIGTASAQQHKTYTVQRGDTLKTISKHFHVPLAELVSENSLTGTHIKAGMRLHIPEPATAGSYIVRKGDNDSVIGHRLGITASRLRQLNPDVDWRALQIGEHLNVPTAEHVQTAQTPDSKYVLVKANHATLRTGPSRDKDKIELVDSGVKAAVLATKTGWYKLKLEDGKTGWMRQDMLSALSTSTKAKESTAVAGETVSRPKAATHASKPAKAESKPVKKENAPARVTPKPAPSKAEPAVVPPARELDIDPADPAYQAPVAASISTKCDLLAPEPVADSAAAGAVSPIVAAESAKMFAALEPGVQPAEPVERAAADEPKTEQPKTAIKKVAARHARHHRSRVSRSGDAYHVPGHDVSADELLKKAYNLRGTRYRYGGLSLSGLDCSGFTTTVFRSEGIQLPRTSRSQSTVGSYVNRAALHPGDLLFFRTGRSSRINHVGIYVGNGKFIHAASGYGAVRVDNLNGHYSHELATARRIPGVKGHNGSNPQPKKSGGDALIPDADAARKDN